MLKVICVICLAAVLFSCNQQKTESAKILTEYYKPGLGEFMTGIQIHHAKLWFAGTAENWKLSQFEIDELKESFADIQKFAADRKEVKMIPIIFPPLDSVASAVNNKNLTQFKTSFTALTNTCNECHQAAEFEFNKVIIPTAPPFNNQDFNISKK
jgi:hypothetical protein